MFAYILRRLWQMLPTMAGVVVLVFVLFNLVGGDPAYILAGKMSSAEDIANIRRQLGTDQPYYVQLWIFVKQIATFDFGNAWSTGEAVSHIIASRLGPSLTVLIPLTLLETLFGIALALGRRSGKGLMAGVAATHNATVPHYSADLRPGEERFMVVVANRQEQARESILPVRASLQAAPPAAPSWRPAAGQSSMPRSLASVGTRRPWRGSRDRRASTS